MEKPNYNSLNLAELQSELDKRRISFKDDSSKEELIQKLKDNDFEKIKSNSNTQKIDNINDKTKQDVSASSEKDITSKKNIENPKETHENQIKDSNTKIEPTVDAIGKAGAIINIILSAISIPVFAILSIVLVGIPFLIGAIFSIIYNSRFMSTGNNKVTAGVLGLFFSGVLGGIFVLVSRTNPIINNN